MTSRPTLLCVHAHPDDEALFTAGITSHYAEQGYRVVLVTCTTGDFGIDATGRGGDVAGHDAVGTKATRAVELAAAGALVGFERLESLGFSDSGMHGWPQNALEAAFINADLEATAQRLADIIDEENASVVVTYDEHGYYGHPDHIMANRLTRAAVVRSKSAERLFYPVTPRRVLEAFLPQAKAAKVHLPAWIEEAVPDIADDAVAVTMDVGRFSERKQRAIATHASQIDNQDLVAMDAALFQLLFGTEYYQLGWCRGETPTLRGDDLFEGLV